VSPSSQARNFATSSSDSWVCGSRGLTRGVGVGGVGGVPAVPPRAPLNAPANLAAARLSDGFTVAPANTASSDALPAAAEGGGVEACGGSACALLPACIPPPPPVAEVPAARGGRRLPNVAKNSLTDGWRAAIPSGSACGSSRAGDSIDSRCLDGRDGGESTGVRSKVGVSSDSGAPAGVGASIDGERGAAGGGEGRSIGGGSRLSATTSGCAARSAASISAILSFSP